MTEGTHMGQDPAASSEPALEPQVSTAVDRDDDSVARDRRRPRRLRTRLVALVPLVALAFGSGGALYSLLSPVEYRSSVLVQVDAATVPGNQSPDEVDDQEVATQRLVMSSEAVADQVIDALQLSVSVQRAQNAVDVQQVNDSRVLRLTATWNSPDGAAAVANAFGEQFLVYRTAQRDAALSALDEAGDDSLRPGPVGEVLTPAVANDDPVGPGPLVIGLLGAVLGAILAVVVALLLDRPETRPRRDEA